MNIEPDQTGVLIGVFVVLVLVSGFFSGSETALFSLGRIQRRKLVDDSSFRAQTILHVLQHPRPWLSTILFGNTLVNVATASVATVISHRLFRDGGLGYAIVIDTIIVLLFGEIIPKTIAVNAPLRFSNTVILPLHGFRNVTKPFVKVFDLAAHTILRLARVPDEIGPGGLNTREIEILFETAAEQETIDAEGRRLARNIIRFSDTSADTIMTPRPDIVAAPLDSSRDSMAELMVKARHSRIPLYEGGVEHIVGFVSTKEFFLNPDRSARELLNPVAIFPEGAPIDRVFRHMQKNRLNMTVIVNEYGDTAGIVTVEDLVEEIVGEIYDEYEVAKRHIREVGERVWVVEGRTPIDEVNATCGTKLHDEDIITLNGYLCEHFGEIPEKGRDAEIEEAKFTVLDATPEQIVSCRVQALSPIEEGTGADDA